MSYNLRAYWEEVNHNNVIDRLEIKELNYSGSTLKLTKSQGFTFNHQEITADSLTGYLNPTYNKILMGVLDFRLWGHDTNTKQLIEDIKSAESKQFLIEWYNGGNAMWFGFASGRILSKPEKDKYLANIQFRDFEVLKNQFYTKNDTRQKIIQTIADIISELGHNMGTFSGNMLQTFTSWQASGTDTDDDFLNQVYHDTIQLREYGRLGDEEDTDITLFEALKYVCAPQLLIYQMYGAFNVIQLSAFEDPENVLRSDYLLNGSQSNSSLQDLSVSTFNTISDGTPIIVQDSENTSYPAIQRVSVDYDHKSLNANINVPDSVQITSPSERKYTMAVRLTGDESIVFSTKNISRVTVPYNNSATFNETDVNVSDDTINIPDFDWDTKVRLKNTAGSLPGGLQENLDYYWKQGGGGSLDIYPYTRADYEVDITSTGATGSVTQVLTIEEVTIKTAEFAITLGGTFYDSGVNNFITPGISYPGMNSDLRNFGIAEVDTVRDRFDINSHGLKNGHLVIFTSSDTLPGGIDADTYYYVVNSSTNTFQISDTYGGAVKDITSTGLGNHTVNRATAIKNLSNTDSLAQYVGDISFDLDDLVADQTVNLNLHLFPTRTLQVGDMDNEYLDETVWEDTILQFIDPSNTSSTSITYQLDRDSATGSEILQLSPIRYGNGPFVYSRSAYRTSTDLEDITTGWKRRGQSTYVDFEELLLKEVMDTQRARPSKLNANIIGTYNPRTVLSYDSKNYAYVGGTYEARWRPVLVEINIQEDGDDVLTEIKRIDPSGSGGIIAGNPETEGLTESEADNRYLQISNDLSDVDDAPTARTNLELGTGDSPTFAGLTVDGLVVEDEIRDLQSDVIENHLEIESLQDNKVEKGQLFPDGDEQALGTGDAVTFSTVDTGQGANELYAMDQDVQQADSPTFNRVVLTNQADDGTKALRADREVNAGNGLTGGGALTSDQTLTLGTPGTTTVGGSNAVTTDSHTHALDLSGRSITLSDDSDGVLTFDTNTQNLGADRTYTPTIADHASGQRGVLNDGTSAQTIYGDKTFNGALTADDSILLDDTAKIESEAGYVSGFTGSGFNLSKDTTWKLELDDMYIRGALFASEFIVNQISAVNGSDILSAGRGKVESFIDDTQYNEEIVVSDPQGGNFASFAVNDIVLVQQVRPNDNQIVKRIVRRVSAVSGADITLAEIPVPDAPTDSGSIEIGDIIVSIGNTTNADRQANIFRTVTDADSPFVRVNDGITSWANWTGVDKLKLQYGLLDGLSSISANISGYGLYAENTFLTGSLLVGDLSKAGNYLEYNGTDLDVVTDSLNVIASTIALSTDSNGKLVLGTDADNQAFDDGIGFYADGNSNFRIGSIAQGADDYISYDTTDGLKIELGGDDLSTAIAEIRSDLIDIYLADQSTFAGIQFLSGQITLKVGADGKVASARLDATGDESAITLRADFFDFQSNDIVLIGDPNQDAGTEAKIALGSNVDTITVANTDSGFIASGAGEFKGYIDANNYIRLNSSGLDIKAESFDLEASNLFVNSGTTSQTPYTPTSQNSLLENYDFSVTPLYAGGAGSDWSGADSSFSTLSYDATNDRTLFDIDKSASSTQVYIEQELDDFSSLIDKEVTFTVSVTNGDSGTSIRNWVVGELYFEINAEIDGSYQVLNRTVIDYSDVTGGGGTDTFNVTGKIRSDFTNVKVVVKFPEQDTTTGAPISSHRIYINSVQTVFYNQTQVTLNTNGLTIYNSPDSQIKLNNSGFSLEGIALKTDDISIPNLVEQNAISTSTMRVADNGYVSLAYTEVGGTSRLYVRLSDGTLKYVNLT